MPSLNRSHITKKIAVITPSRFPGSAGDTANYSEIMNQLIDENFKVILICPNNPNNNTTGILLPEITVVRIPSTPPRLVEVQGRLRAGQFLQLISFLVNEFITIFRTLKKNNVKHVYIRHGHLTMHIPILLKLMRIKTIADGEFFADSSDNLGLPPIFLKILRHYETRILRLYSRYRVSSFNQLERLQKIGYPRENIVLIPMSINLNRVPRLQMNEIPSHTFGYFGGLEPWQGIDILVKAFQLLLQEIPSAILYIIGEGSMRQQLMKIAEENNLISKVIFVGGIQREKIWNEYFNKFRILVVPRPKLNNSIDSLPSLKIIEAFAAGKPVIATDIPAMKDFPKDSLLLVQPNDPSGLSRAMKSLSQNESSLLKYSLVALNYVKKHDIKQNIRLFIDCLIN